MKTLAIVGLLWCGLCVVVAVGLYGLAAYGFVSDAVVAQSGLAILAAEGKLAFGDLVSAYPPLPLWLTAGIAVLLPFVPLPALAATSVLSALMISVVFAVAAKRLGTPAGLAIALLFAANPLFLVILAEGPSEVMLLLSALLFANSAFSLRRDESVMALMNVSLSLVLVFFSHTYGLIFAFAALPLSLLLMPPELAARAPISSLLILGFPLFFAIFATGLLSRMFGQNDWALLSGFAFSAVPERMGKGLDAMATLALATALCAPGLIVSLALAMRRSFLSMPVLVLIGLVLGGAALALVTMQTPSLIVLMTPILAFGTVAAILVPVSRLAGFATTGLMALAMAGGGALALEVPSQASSDWRAFANSTPPNRDSVREELLALLATRSDVMLDAWAHPELIALSGTAATFIVPGESRFEMEMLSRRFHAATIVLRVGNAPGAIKDRVANAFSQARASATRQDYELVFSADGWQVYELRNQSDLQEKDA